MVAMEGGRKGGSGVAMEEGFGVIRILPVEISVVTIVIVVVVVASVV